MKRYVPKAAFLLLSLLYNEEFRRTGNVLTKLNFYVSVYILNAKLIFLNASFAHKLVIQILP